LIFDSSTGGIRKGVEGEPPVVLFYKAPRIFPAAHERPPKLPLAECLVRTKSDDPAGVRHAKRQTQPPTLHVTATRNCPMNSLSPWHKCGGFVAPALSTPWESVNLSPRELLWDEHSKCVLLAEALQSSSFPKTRAHDPITGKPIDIAQWQRGELRRQQRRGTVSMLISKE
jgi:hypothetical protein